MGLPVTRQPLQWMRADILNKKGFGPAHISSSRSPISVWNAIERNFWRNESVIYFSFKVWAVCSCDVARCTLHEGPSEGCRRHVEDSTIFLKSQNFQEFNLFFNDVCIHPWQDPSVSHLFQCECRLGEKSFTGLKQTHTHSRFVEPYNFQLFDKCVKDRAKVVVVVSKPWQWH